MTKPIKIIEVVKDPKGYEPVIDWEGGIDERDKVAKPWSHIYEKCMNTEAVIFFELSDKPSEEWLNAFRDTLHKNSEKSLRVGLAGEVKRIGLAIPAEKVKIPGADTEELGIKRDTVKCLVKAIPLALAAANKATLFDEDALFSPSNLNPPKEAEKEIASILTKDFAKFCVENKILPPLLPPKEYGTAPKARF